jgi:hypothetical protein
MRTIIEEGLNIKAGDKFTTYQGRGIFTIKEVFDKSIQAYNSEDIYTYNIDTDDLIKLKINLIKT